MNGPRPTFDPPPNLWPILPKDPPVLSERFKWRNEVGAHVYYVPNREHRNEWRAQIGFTLVIADTEDEAEIALCQKRNRQHYSK